MLLYYYIIILLYYSIILLVYYSIILLLYYYLQATASAADLLSIGWVDAFWKAGRLAGLARMLSNLNQPKRAAVAPIEIYSYY